MLLNQLFLYLTHCVGLWIRWVYSFPNSWKRLKSHLSVKILTAAAGFTVWKCWVDRRIITTFVFSSFVDNNSDNDKDCYIWIWLIREGKGSGKENLPWTLFPCLPLSSFECWSLPGVSESPEGGSWIFRKEIPCWRGFLHTHGTRLSVLPTIYQHVSTSSVVCCKGDWYIWFLLGKEKNRGRIPFSSGPSVCALLLQWAGLTIYDPTLQASWQGWQKFCVMKSPIQRNCPRSSMTTF